MFYPTGILVSILLKFLAIDNIQQFSFTASYHAHNSLKHCFLKSGHSFPRSTVSIISQKRLYDLDILNLCILVLQIKRVSERLAFYKRYLMQIIDENMKEEKFEDIYNSSIDIIVEKFRTSKDDFFFTEKDLHFHFFHTCLNRNPSEFEHKKRLLLHSEYPMPFRATTENKSIKIVKDDDGNKRRPAIDSVLLNKNFIDWLLNYKTDLGACPRIIPRIIS